MSPPREGACLSAWARAAWVCLAPTLPGLRRPVPLHGDLADRSSKRKTLGPHAGTPTGARQELLLQGPGDEALLLGLARGTVAARSSRRSQALLSGATDELEGVGAPVGQDAEGERDVLAVVDAVFQALGGPTLVYRGYPTGWEAPLRP